MNCPDTYERCSLRIDRSFSTQDVQRAIDYAEDNNLQVEISPGVEVDQPIVFDPSGKYIGCGVVRELRYRPENSAHITSTYTGPDPAFQLKPRADDNVAFQPVFDCISLHRSNTDGTAFQIRNCLLYTSDAADE